MKTIQLQIDDNNYDSFMTIIQNLKDGFIKQFSVTDSEIKIISGSEQQYYDNLLQNLNEDDKKIMDSYSIEI
ncbi:MAG: hypothetical protein U9N02_00805 [Campylobacterota bacterium]|nr:hypothetical protein [Campylobacterota bacterium]